VSGAKEEQAITPSPSDGPSPCALTPACEHCGCTEWSACAVEDLLTGEERGCSWDPRFLEAGRYVCECCIHLVAPLEAKA
jgi:hypothetical protein